MEIQERTADRSFRSFRALGAALIALSLVIGAMLALGGTASAGHDALGVCHRTMGTNAFVYIEPDASSSHLDDEENPLQGHEGDRAATEAEAAAGQCFAQQPTQTPTTPAETPTTPAQTPTTPAETPTTPAATTPAAEGTTPAVQPTTPAVTGTTPAAAATTPVVALPETGAGDGASGRGATSLLLGVAAMILLGGAVVSRRMALSRS